MDMCFELAAQIMSRLGGAVTTADEVHGFKYFDDRDLLGFVDGTENPVDQAAVDATVIGEEDPAFAGGSYVIVQKYLHDLKGWNAVPVEQQEGFVGRTKLSDIELDDAVKPSFAHNALTVIEENGEELKIVRANMPFGEVGKGEYGTYFCGYARSPRKIELMLENMFVGKPPGNYDRLLDFSRRRDRDAVLRAVGDVPGRVAAEAATAESEAAAIGTQPHPTVRSASVPCEDAWKRSHPLVAARSASSPHLPPAARCRPLPRRPPSRRGRSG